MRPWHLSNHASVNLKGLLEHDCLPGAQTFFVESLEGSHTASPKLRLLQVFLEASVPRPVRTFGPWLHPGSWVPMKSSLDILSECCCFQISRHHSPFLKAQRPCFAGSSLSFPDPTCGIFTGVRVGGREGLGIEGFLPKLG